jgi:hypothetical protein
MQMTKKKEILYKICTEVVQRYSDLQMKVFLSLRKKLSHIFYKKLEDKYYLSIRDLPIKQWFAIYEVNNYTPLCKVGKPDYRASKVHETLQAEIIAFFGITKDVTKQIKLQIAIELMYAKMFAKNDKSMILQIEAKENELELLQKRDGKFSLHDSIVSMNKAGIHCDINTLTTYDFFKYSESLTKLIQNENN